ncbi:YbhB/YbcL family Raf kinase inhibitor-like protein [Caldivirga maquilingensis]|uniref:PEBP family protein n=1 Tax=Caldivirga maquilingensis (strain ATCC 700844 / DSM 13496 / JCM 10307 / IC-167) TaxID=397948 RepID=A8MBL1_CALMQ|nr:YbhB/YbcL family Raf kinase inhibitor-like protein [Caldivirga maquilingensis]ABW02744.1 PEBP family protein [Caldivirga maquilingensis IC-167]
MRIESPAFRNEDTIPVKYTCDGDDVSPALRWFDPPPNVKGFVLIMEDPDAPMGTFTHWILYNIPPSLSELPENIPKRPEVQGIGMQGVNDFGRIGYGGPCPPKTHPPHRYYFRLYALDSMLNLKPGAGLSEVKRAMNGHVIAEAYVMGRYGRRR